MKFAQSTEVQRQAILKGSAFCNKHSNQSYTKPSRPNRRHKKSWKRA